MIVLRPYQENAKAAIYEHLRSRDDNPACVIPTAGGKTPILASICKDAVDLWNGRVLILAHVKELLEQAADKLRAVCPELDFGIYSAGLKRRDTRHPVIVAGIQSVYKRACELDAFDLIICDECHLIPRDGDGMYRQFLRDAKVVNPHVRIIGLTATPYRLDSGLICAPDHFLNSVCYEVGIRELIRDGYLCPPVSKAGKALADTSNLHLRGGEFIPDEVEDLMDQDDLVVSACREILDFTRDRHTALIFTSGISGSLENFQNTPVINVVAPGSSAYLGKFAVLQEPLAASYLGDAVVSGVTVSQITMNHASHDRADVDPAGGASLVSAYYGAAEILYVESGTGSKWAVLRLGSFVAPLLKAKSGDQIAVGGSGSVTIYRNGSATESVTAHLNWMDGNQAVAANSELLIQYFRDEAKWIIVGAECTT